MQTIHVKKNSIQTKFQNFLKTNENAPAERLVTEFLVPTEQNKIQSIIKSFQINKVSGSISIPKNCKISLPSSPQIDFSFETEISNVSWQ